MEHIKRLNNLKGMFEDCGLTISYMLIHDSDNEILFTYTVRWGFNIVLEKSNILNACDLRTNVEGLNMEIEYLEFLDKKELIT